MPICKDCLHGDVCFTVLNSMQCQHFKDRSRLVELPCKVGDLVFFIYAHRVMADIVSKFVIEKGRIKLQRINGYDLGYADQIGERLFLTCEEAEQALKERKENEK